MPHKDRFHLVVFPAWYPSEGSMSGNYVEHQASMFARRGHEMAVFLFSYASFSTMFSAKRKPPKWKRNNALRLFPFHFQSRVPISASKTLLRRQKNKLIHSAINAFGSYIERHGRPDFLHLHSVVGHAFIPWNISKYFNIPYLITEHYSAFDNAGESRFQPFSSMAEVSTIVKGAFERIAVSHYFGSKYSHLFGCRYRVIPNMVSDTFCGNLCNRRDKAGPFTFANVGNLSPHKGQMDLLHAFAIVFRNRAVRLRVVGEGPQKENLMQKAEDLGISSQVQFMGRCAPEQICRLLDQSDAYVLPSHYETFGIALAEALCRGLPSVATRCGGPNEMIDASNGCLCKPDDPESLAQSLRYLLDHAMTFDRMKVSMDALKKYAPDVVIGQYERLIGSAPAN